MRKEKFEKLEELICEANEAFSFGNIDLGNAILEETLDLAHKTDLFIVKEKE